MAESIKISDPRKIIHVDMDAFYASVEVMDNPSLAGKPLIVGGNPHSRSVVAAASYEARKFGVRSAMPCFKALQACPQAIFVPPRMQRYQEVSRILSDTLSEFSDIVEKVSLDEAWIDVTENLKGVRLASKIGRMIKQEVAARTGITCSVGVSYCKIFSKLASEENKPDGFFVLPPEQALDFLMGKSVGCIPGVGGVTFKKMQELNIVTCQDLREKDREYMLKHFGKTGQFFYNIVRGHDPRPVGAERSDKSISLETTFERDYSWGARIEQEIQKLCTRMKSRMDRKRMTGRSLTLKIKFHDFRQITRSLLSPYFYIDFESLHEDSLRYVRSILTEEFPDAKIRLLGIGVTKLRPLEQIGYQSQPSLLDTLSKTSPPT